MDVKKNIEEVRSIIDKLDLPIPEVLIEAKIIQINPTYTNELGVMWSGQYTSKSSTYNLGVGGGQNINESNTKISSIGPGMDLTPQDIGPGTGASIALGYITKNFNIFNKIAAMEEDQKLEVISSPRVLTLDNQEALVEQGTEVPYMQIDTQTTQTATLATVQFKKVTLSLKVVPHVTPDGSVMMDVEAKKDQVSAILGAGGQPGIDTRKAITKVLVPSGDTVVIGGIYEDTNRNIITVFLILAGCLFLASFLEAPK